LQLVASNETVKSMADVVMVPTTAAHIREIKKTIRDKDRAEIESFGISCAKGLWRSYKHGMGNQTAIINGHVAAIWGVGGCYIGNVGAPWLMTSKYIALISPLRFARLYQQEVYKMLNMFPYLENYVDASYEEAVRLLSIVGFTIGDPERIGNGVYKKFSMEREG